MGTNDNAALIKALQQQKKVLGDRKSTLKDRKTDVTKLQGRIDNDFRDDATKLKRTISKLTSNLTSAIKGSPVVNGTVSAISNEENNIYGLGEMREEDYVTKEIHRIDKEIDKLDERIWGIDEQIRRASMSSQ